ncbi:MAG: hypothetical protein WDM79_14930 [Terricaulis sp.]
MIVKGEREPTNDSLQRSITIFEEAIPLYDRESQVWAVSMTLYGSALGILGGRRSDREMLDRSTSVLQSALDHLDRESDPLFWRNTEMGLGLVQFNLAQRDDAQAIGKAIDALREKNIANAQVMTGMLSGRPLGCRRCDR